MSPLLTAIDARAAGIPALRRILKSNEARIDVNGEVVREPEIARGAQNLPF